MTEYHVLPSEQFARSSPLANYLVLQGMLARLDHRIKIAVDSEFLGVQDGGIHCRVGY